VKLAELSGRKKGGGGGGYLNDKIHELETSYCQVFNVHAVNDARHTKIRTAEPLVPEPSSFENEIVVQKLKRYTIES
jgi:hypothetical protein